MQVRVFADPAELGEFAAEQVLSAIAERPDAVIGLATGSSPLPLYRAWARLAADRGIDLSNVRGFALDEYAGIDRAHPESYHAVIAREVTEPLGLTPELVRVPPTEATPEAASSYEQAIANAGGVDVQILGVGRNGHLAFNEPGSPLDSRTRRIQLQPETIADNARFFASIEDVPSEAITQGLGTIMEARQLVVLAAGEAKAPAVAAALTGPVTSDLPASIAQLHPNVLFVLDEAAAALLPEGVLS